MRRLENDPRNRNGILHELYLRGGAEYLYLRQLESRRLALRGGKSIRVVTMFLNFQLISSTLI